ncbi:MAG: HNH endonuclease [Actinomycetota bacterium]|nr:HNH endonuclease [Actinomycetota bacterium]
MEVVEEREAEVAELEAEMASLCGIVNAATGRLVSVIAKGLTTGAWEQSGIRSPSHWVSWKCGLSLSRARRVVSMAKRASGLPECHAAFCGGELSEDQMAVVVRHAPGANDAEVASFAREATVPQLERTLRAYNFDTALNGDGTDGGGPEPQPEPEETRTASFGDTERGTWRLGAELPLDEGAGVEAALEQARRDLVAGGNTRATLCDALVSIAESYLAAGAVGRPYGDRHTTMLHLRTDDDGRRGGHLHLGPVLPDALRRLLDCDGHIRPVFEVGGIAVNLGRSARIVPDKVRTVVEERDGGCRGPGCANTKWLQIHHVQHWEDGGRTDTCNLVALCSVCHRRHHLGLLPISGNADDPDGLIFTDARGRLVDGAGKPIPPPRLEPMGNWRHPSGERLDPHSVQFSSPRDPKADAEIAFIRSERDARERRAEAS